MEARRNTPNFNDFSSEKSDLNALFSAIQYGSLVTIFNIIERLGPDKKNDQKKKPLFYSLISQFIPTIDILEEIVKFTRGLRIVEINSGRAFLSKCLTIYSEGEIDIIPTTSKKTNKIPHLESFSSNFPKNKFYNKRFSRVRKLKNAESINDYQPDVLLFTGKYKFEYDCLKNFYGNKIIYIGEYDDNNKFFKELLEKWDFYQVVNLPNWDGENISCYFFIRKFIELDEKNEESLEVTLYNSKTFENFKIRENVHNFGVSKVTLPTGYINVFNSDQKFSPDVSDENKGIPLISFNNITYCNIVILLPKNNDDYPFIFTFHMPPGSCGKDVDLDEMSTVQVPVTNFIDKVNQTTNWFGKRFDNRPDMDLIIIGKNVNIRRKFFLESKLSNIEYFNSIESQVFEFPEYITDTFAEGNMTFREGKLISSFSGDLSCFDINFFPYMDNLDERIFYIRGHGKNKGNDKLVKF